MINLWTGDPLPFCGPYSKTGPMSREADLNRLYRIFENLEDQVGGMQRLKDCTGYMDWPERGVYFFFARVLPSVSGYVFRVIWLSNIE